MGCLVYGRTKGGVKREEKDQERGGLSGGS